MKKYIYKLDQPLKLLYFFTNMNEVLYCKPFEPEHDRTNKMTCAPSEASDQPEHLPSLIRVFAVCMKKPWALASHLAHSKDWSDRVDA